MRHNLPFGYEPKMLIQVPISGKFVRDSVSRIRLVGADISGRLEETVCQLNNKSDIRLFDCIDCVVCIECGLTLQAERVYIRVSQYLEEGVVGCLNL